MAPRELRIARGGLPGRGTLVGRGGSGVVLTHAALAVSARAARGHQGDGQRAPRIATSGVIAAAFEHHTSRADDPQLHTHVLLLNLTQGVDGRWSALNSRTQHRQATTASYLYQHRLRAELTTRLGISWTAVERGVVEIDGIPKNLSRVFSTRRRQIEAHLAQHPVTRTQPEGQRLGRVGQLAARAACLITRPANSTPHRRRGRPAGGPKPARSDSPKRTSTRCWTGRPPHPCCRTRRC